MTFDDITQDGRLWAVKYDNDEDNILDKVFEQWSDIVWLRAFFIENKDDLASYFKVTDVNQAIYDTIEDADKLQCLILDISPNANLDQIFRHLEPSRTSETVLGKEKAKGANATMQERAHTLAELLKMEQVRNFLISKDVIDDDGFKDYLREL